MITNALFAEGFEHFRKFMEVAYYFSGLFLAGIGIYASKQVNILKRDISTRNERAAKEKALEYADRYLDKFVKLVDISVKSLQDKKLPVSYNGPKTDPEFRTCPSPKQNFEMAAARLKGADWVYHLNELETIAAAFIMGIADESAGFEIIGRSYCFTVATRYDILCLLRFPAEKPHYESIVRLYKAWAPRLTKAEIDGQASHLSKRAEELRDQSQKISDTSIPPIGS